mgnify:FL=1
MWGNHFFGRPCMQGAPRKNKIADSEQSSGFWRLLFSRSQISRKRTSFAAGKSEGENPSSGGAGTRFGSCIPDEFVLNYGRL